MTFIELLVAIALAALVITAASMMAYSFTHIWTSMQVRPQFGQHVQGVTTTLEALFERTDVLSGDTAKPWGWSTPPEVGTEPLLAFRLQDPPPIFVLPYGPKDTVNAWLDFDPERKQLWLIWHTSPRLTKGTLTIKHTLLSDQIEDVEFGYLDTDSNLWEFESIGQSGRNHEGQSPSRLRLTFAPDGDSSAPVHRTINPVRPLKRILIY